MESLVAYSSSDSSSSDSDVSDRKVKRLKESSSHRGAASEPPASSCLPPAAALLDGTYSPPPAHEQREIAREVLYQGRSRRFKPPFGSCATHVCISVDTPAACLAALDELLLLLRKRFPGLHPTTPAPTSPAAAPGPGGAAPAAQGQLAQPRYHVSLSHTVPVRLEQVGPLAGELRRRLRHQQVFSFRLGEPEVFCNGDRSRTFLALRACDDRQHSPAAAAGAQLEEQPAEAEAGREAGQEAEAEGGAEAEAAGEETGGYSPHLVAACRLVSRLFAECGLPPFHEDPHPHASVAWLLGDQEAALLAALAEPRARAATGRLARHQWTVRPKVILCKAGREEHAVWEPPPG